MKPTPAASRRGIKPNASQIKPFDQRCEKRLNAFTVYASDGHSLAAASHEKPIKGKIRAINPIYTLNQRSQSLEHLALTWSAQGKKKEHELCALKRLDSQACFEHRTGWRVAIVQLRPLMEAYS